MCSHEGVTGISYQGKTRFNLHLTAQLLLLAVLCLVFFWKILFAGSDKIIAGYDILVGHYYSHAFTRESLLRGVIPKWNPYEYAGTPFAADPANFVFYPLDKLFLFIPIAKSISLSLVFHVFLAGAGTLLFARRIGLGFGGSLISAIAFMFGGYFIDRIGIGHEIMILGSAYLPWIFLCYEIASQKNELAVCLVGGVFVGLQALSASAQPMLYTAISVLVYAVVKSLCGQTDNRVKLLGRNVGYLVLMGILGVGIAAIQMVPSLEFVRHTARSATTMDFVRSFSFPPRNFLHFLFPYLDIGRAITNWEYTCYLGIFPLALALATITTTWNAKTVPFAAVGTIAAAIMLARHNVLFPFMAEIVPALKLFRVHARAELGFIFALSLLAGIGWNVCFSDDAEKSRRLRIMLVTVSALFCVTALVVTMLFVQGKVSIHYMLPFPGKGFGGFTDAGENILSLLHKRFLFPISLIFLSLLASLILFRTTSKYVGSLLLVLVVADLFLINSGRIQLISTDYLTQSNDLIEFVKSNQGSQYSRVWLPESLFFPSQAKYFKIFDVNGYSPLALKEFEEYLASLTGIEQVRNPDHTMNKLIFVKKKQPPENILNVRFFGYNPPKGQLPVIEIWPASLPHAYFVADYKKGSPSEFFASKFDLQRTVFLNAAKPEGHKELETTAGEARVEIKSYSNDEIHLAVKAPTDGFVVLSEVYYPGWRAEIDGNPAKVFRGDYLLRVVPVTKGEHTIRLFFAPLSLLIGETVTALTLLITAALLILYWRRSRPA